jgi:hypothetical protein
MLASCTTQYIPISSKLNLFRIESDTIINDRHEVKVDYKGLYNQNYKFEVSIRNNTKDSIFVNPSSFKYSVISENTGIDSIHINAINLEERIENLKFKEDCLKNLRNPYSLEKKSVKEIVVEGLIEGTIGLIFGQSGDELESQRQINEDDWDQEHNLKLCKVNEELYFWNNNALLPSVIPPKDKVSGKVLFPVKLNTNEIIIVIQIQNDLYKFRFKQQN